MPYDIQGALGAGYSPADLTAWLAANPDKAWFRPDSGGAPQQYDVAGALKAGLSPERIIGTVSPASRPSLDPLVAANTPPPAGTAAATQTGPTAAPAPTPEAPATSQAPGSPPPGYILSDTGTFLPDPNAAQPAAGTASGHHLRMNVAAAVGAGWGAQDITNHLAQDQGPVGTQMRTALKWYSPEEIIDHLNPSRGQADYQGVPILAPIQRGLTAAEGGVANLAQDVGLPGVAGAIRSHLSQAVVDTKTSASNVVDGMRGGHYGAALEAVPSALLEGALPAAATIGAGAVAGPVAAIGTAAGYSALTQGDAIARARAANNGRAAPNAADLALGLGGAAGVGAMGSVGLPGALGNAAGAGLKGAMLSSAAHAAADAAMPQAASLAGSVGTQAGAQLAPASDSTAAALTGLASRGAMSTPEVVNAALRLTPGGRNAALADRYAGMTPEQQQQVANVAGAYKAMQDVTANAIGTTAASPRAAAATASDNMQTGAAQLTAKLMQSGLIGQPESDTIGNAINAARSPSKVLTQDHLTAMDGLGLPQEDAAALKNAAVQMQLLSDPDTLNAASGPFRTIAEAMGGHVGGAIVGGLLTGGLHGAGAGYLLGSAVRPVTRSTLGSLGGALDDAIGSSKSPLQRSADDGQALLNAAGVQVPSATDDLAAAVLRSRSAIAQQRVLLNGGLPPAMQTAALRAASLQGAASGPATAPTQAGNPVAVAVARAAAQSPSASSAAGPSGSSAPSPSGTYAPDTSGLSPDAMALAKRLPAWVWGLGNDLQTALHVSGQARPVNMAGEVNNSLNRLQARGLIPDDIADGLKAHDGRIVPTLYELLRNDMLTTNGIDRTAGGAGVGSAAGP